MFIRYIFKIKPIIAFLLVIFNNKINVFNNHWY